MTHDFAIETLTRFIAAVNTAHGLSLNDYDTLYDWSVTHPSEFWEALWTFVAIKSHTPYDQVMGDEPMPETSWFFGSSLNMAEHLLRYRDDKLAIVWHTENDAPPIEMTYAELYQQVAKVPTFPPGCWC